MMMKKTMALAAATCLFAAVAVGCGDDDSEGGGGGGGGDVRSQLAAQLQEEMATDGITMSDEDAGCIAGQVVDLIGDEEAEKLAADPDYEPESGDFSDDQMMQVFDDCDIDIMEMMMEQIEAEG